MTMSFKQAEMRRDVARRNILRAWGDMAEQEAKRAERDTKKLEVATRRRLKADGYTLKKIPAAHSNRELFGIGYMVLNDRNVVELGATSREYDASLEDVAKFAGVEAAY